MVKGGGVGPEVSGDGSHAMLAASIAAAAIPRRGDGRLNAGLAAIGGRLDQIPVSGAFRVTVECYGGHRGEETPRRFTLGSRTVEVVDVLDRWLAPEHRYFKIRGSDNDAYILRHDVRDGSWELTLYVREAPR